MSLRYPVASERGTSIGQPALLQPQTDSQKKVIVLSSNPPDPAVLKRTAELFGWGVLIGSDPRVVPPIETSRIAAILFDPPGVEGKEDASWSDAIATIRGIHPNVPLIACLSMSDGAEWVYLRQAGAFHALHVPVLDGELYQSLGFVWAAASRISLLRTNAA